MQEQEKSSSMECLILDNETSYSKQKAYILENQKRFSKIILMVESIQQKISYLKDTWPHISETQMKTCIHTFPNITELKNQILSFAPFSHFKHDYPKQINTFVPTLPKITQMHAQCYHLQNPSVLEAFSSKFQNDLIDYFSRYDKISELPIQIQSTLSKLIEPMSNPFSPQVNFPISQMNQNEQNLLQDGEQFIEAQKVTQKGNKQNKKNEKGIDKILKNKTEQILNSMQKCEQNHFIGEKSEKPSFLYDSAQEDQNKQISEQSYQEGKAIDEMPIFQIKDQQRQSFQVHSIPMENSKQIGLEKYENKQKYLKPMDAKGIHLSASVESLTYEFGKQDAHHKSRRQNKHAVGWDHHPELDLIESQEIGQSKNHNMYESFATSSRINKHSLNFKQSCIEKKKSNNKIFETVNFKENLMYVINSETSSEGSKTDREMLMSEMVKKTETMQINLHENMIKQVTFEVSEYYDLQDKLCASEEKNQQLHEILQSYEEEINCLKEKINQQKVISCEDQSEKRMPHRDEWKQLYEKQSNQLKNLEKQLIFRSNQQLSLELKNGSLNQQLKQTKNQLLAKKYQISQLNQHLKQIEICFTKEIQIVKEQLVFKATLLKEAQIVNEEKNKEFYIEKKQIIKVNQSLKIDLEEALRQNQSIKIQSRDLQQENQFFKEHIEELEKQKVDALNIKKFSDEQYEKLKQNLIYEYQLKQSQCQKLQFQNQRLHKEVLINIQELESHKDVLQDHQKIIEDLQKKLESYQGNRKKNKIISFENDTSFLKRKLHYACKQLELKDLQIKQLDFQLTKIRKAQGKKQYFCQNEKNQQKDLMCDMKEIISEYEQIINHHHDIIKELQEQVYEYLTDAIEKQNQGERLYEDLVSLQKDFHDLMVDKINLEIQNKKLKKTIKLSERKISSIGNKLIYVAKDKLQENTSEERKIKNTFKSQNSTVRLGHFEI